jgi:CRP/FNR family transcriptional regulator, dissimilatory nitrate respiration regulator
VGSASHAVFFIETGAVRLMRRGRDGEEIVLHRARAGEFFAEASIDSARYHCDAIAMEKTEVLKVSAANLTDLIKADPDFARHWVSLLARQLRKVRSRVERLSMKSAKERIRHLLISDGLGPHCEVRINGTLKDLARDLGLTHETLYRTLATMERTGQIERRRGTLRLAR